MKDVLKFFFLILSMSDVTGVVAQVTVTGIVTDADGIPILGTTIADKGTNTGIATDIDGSYSLNVSEGATLVFSFTGLLSKEMNAGTGGQLNEVLDTIANVFEEVFVTATSKSIRRIEAVTAVDSISAKEIERMIPTSLVDLVRFAPSIYVQTQAGRVRNFIFTRRFPDATNNGFICSALMIDGVRTFASTEIVPDASFKNDLNVDKVEVVSGSAATLYGRGSAAGAINVISKTGGTESKGTLKATYGQYNCLQLDAGEVYIFI